MSLKIETRTKKAANETFDLITNESVLVYTDENGIDRTVTENNEGSRTIHLNEAEETIKEHLIKDKFASIYTISEDELKTQKSSEEFKSLFESYHLETKNERIRIDEVEDSFSQYNKNQYSFPFYDSCVANYNLSQYNRTFDVFDPSSDIYTNIINLDKLYSDSLMKSEPLSARATITIQFSKFREDTIYQATTILELFNKGERLDVVQEIGDNISLNYINGQISIIPLDLKIAECIISKCTITYGKL